MHTSMRGAEKAQKDSTEKYGRTFWKSTEKYGRIPLRKNTDAVLPGKLIKHVTRH